VKRVKSGWSLFLLKRENGPHNPVYIVLRTDYSTNYSNRFKNIACHRPNFLG
jgi:hypothetical protein